MTVARGALRCETTPERHVEFAEEAVYHVLVALPIPLVIAVFAYRAHALAISVMLFAAGALVFLVVFWLSYFLFCVGCT